MLRDIKGELKTDCRDIFLSPLETDDTGQLFDLVQSNKSHLTSHGDYQDLTAHTREQIHADLENPKANELSFAIRKESSILGVVTLIYYRPRIFGVGYWIGFDHTGQGYVTASCRGLICMAKETLKALEIWAGIKHGNFASIEIVTRLGFVLAREQDTHLSYVLQIDGGAGSFN